MTVHLVKWFWWLGLRQMISSLPTAMVDKHSPNHCTALLISHYYHLQSKKTSATVKLVQSLNNVM